MALCANYRGRPCAKNGGAFLFLASLGMGLCGGPVYLGGELTTAMNIGLIYSAAPLLIALLAFMRFGEKLSYWQMLGMVMGLCGVAIILTKADFSRLATLRFNKRVIYGLCWRRQVLPFIPLG